MASDASSRQHSCSMENDRPVIQSLDEAEVDIAQEVRDYLTESLGGLHDNVESEARKHMDRILQAMKTAPSMTTCRVNQIRATTEEIKEGLGKEVVAWQNRHRREDQRDETVTSVPVRPHPVLNDVVCVGERDPDASNSLSSCRVPPVSSSTDCTSLFKAWPKRADMGWPMTHRVVICDRFCGEAVLRGSDIFVRGVICTDSGIRIGEQVAVRTCLPFFLARHVVRYSLAERLFLNVGICRYSSRWSKALLKRLDDQKLYR